jgi:hypothetical protein
VTGSVLDVIDYRCTLIEHGSASAARQIVMAPKED